MKDSRLTGMFQDCWDGLIQREGPERVVLGGERAGTIQHRIKGALLYWQNRLIKPRHSRRSLNHVRIASLPV